MAGKNKIVVVAFLGFLIWPFNSLARENVFDWYIKDFFSGILVNPDSSLLITERITADCGSCAGKHGIFRVLPTQINTPQGAIQTPVQLVSITDFQDRPLKYSETFNPFDHTVTWKIGDPDVEVTDLNYYKIVYRVQNAIRFGNTAFDELYWNLNGNFWDLQIDSFTGNLVFPSAVTANNTQIDYYTGEAGSQDKGLASYTWPTDNVLQFTASNLLERQGITVSVTFPKGIFTPYQPGFAEQYGRYFWFLLPLVSFWFCFKTWKKYGQDPRINRSITPEYESPENIAPMSMGMLLNNAKLENKLISASIVNFAVKGLISIEEMKKSWPLADQDFKLKRLASPDKTLDGLTGAEKLLLKKLFQGKEEVTLSSLKDNFYQDLPEIEKTARQTLIDNDLITKEGLSFRIRFFIIGILLFLGSNLTLGLLSNSQKLFSFAAEPSIILATVFFFIFGFFMPKRTQKGAETLWRVKGFKLYMETAEKHRQRFFEKENIFEELLPFAMVFGITGLWIKKMKEIYGEKYFATYHPAWYVGSYPGSFNADNFSAAINSVSSSISSNMGTSSGASGSGFSGGGGGGGGGGGW